MVPPRCYVCDLSHRDLPDDGRDYFTLIYFGPDDNAKMAPSRTMANLGRTGHPRNAIWFCHQHTSLARQHEHLNTSDGLAAIDAATGRTPHTHPVTTMTADELPTVKTCARQIARPPGPACRRHVQTGPPQRRKPLPSSAPRRQQMPDDGAHRDGRTTVKRSWNDPQGL